MAGSIADLDVHLQPIVSLPAGDLVQVEALARWPGRDGLVASPDEFIPEADRSGLIHPLGQRVLDRACELAAGWRAGGQDVAVSVNVSARQLEDPAFADQLCDTLSRHRLPAPALCLELTESSIVRDPDGAAELLSTLRELGVRIALDDFGTGSSSLTLLRQLPVDILKIDRSFVAQVTEQPRDAVLVRILTDAAHALGLTVCAEGVESVEQARQLTALGVERGQGWLFGRPAPVTASGQLPVAQWPRAAVDVRVAPTLPLGATEDIVVVTDADDRVLYASPTAGDQLGLSSAELVGTDAGSFVHPDDLPVLRPGSGWATVRVSGGRRPGWRTWQVFARGDRLHRKGLPAETLWLCRDVTERVAADDRAHRHQELFRLSFEESPVGMAVSTLDGTLLQVNDAFAKLLRVTQRRIVGTTVADWTHPEDRAVDAFNTEALTTGSAISHTLDKRFVTGAGQIVPVTVVATVLDDEAGPPVVVAHVVRRS